MLFIVLFSRNRKIFSQLLIIFVTKNIHIKMSCPNRYTALCQAFNATCCRKCVEACDPPVSESHHDAFQNVSIYRKRGECES